VDPIQYLLDSCTEEEDDDHITNDGKNSLHVRLSTLQQSDVQVTVHRDTFLE